MKLVFLGSGQFGIDSLDALRDSDHDLEFIVTQPAQKAGRGQKLMKYEMISGLEIHAQLMTRTKALLLGARLNRSSPKRVGGSGLLSWLKSRNSLVLLD